ncbi:hypothetical protein HYY75_12620, partial [bacterium]|nr:hypothetical protein [bacterium]
MFKFKLDSILSYAQHEEEEVKMRLAVKDGQIAEVESKIQGLISDYNSGLESKAEDLKAGRMKNVPMYSAYFIRLKRAEAFHREEKE